MVSEVIVSGVADTGIEDIVDCADTGLMIVSAGTGLMIVSAIVAVGFEDIADNDDKDVSWYGCEVMSCSGSCIVGLFSGAIDEVSALEIIDTFQNTGVSSMLGDWLAEKIGRAHVWTPVT